MDGSGSSTSHDVSSVGMDGSGSSTSNEFPSDLIDDTGINTTYVISPVKESDNGTYKCVANINGSLHMNNILLTVKGNFDT